jgi:hypothetical protein
MTKLYYCGVLNVKQEHSQLISFFKQRCTMLQLDLDLKKIAESCT